MPQPRKYLNGAYGTHNVDINIPTGDKMGTKQVMDMHSDTVSMNSSVSNDISSGTTIGSSPRVTGNVLLDGNMGDTSIKNLHKKSGSGWVNPV